MAKLKPVARAALRRKAFQHLIADYMAGTIDWSDSSLKPLKDLIRALLRIEQKEICPYCQRIIIPERRNVSEHIEHFLDKSRPKYKKFAFVATNIILTCDACNVEKGIRDLGRPGAATPAYLSALEAPFLWPHPYFDDLTACIRKRPGPVYEPIIGSGREQQAARLIADLKLDNVRRIETRYGRLMARRIKIMRILGRLARQNTDRSRRRMVPLTLELERVTEHLR